MKKTLSLGISVVNILIWFFLLGFMIYRRFSLKEPESDSLAWYLTTKALEFNTVLTLAGLVIGVILLLSIISRLNAVAEKSKKLSLASCVSSMIGTVCLYFFYVFVIIDPKADIWLYVVYLILIASIICGPIAVVFLIKARKCNKKHNGSE